MEHGEWPVIDATSSILPYGRRHRSEQLIRVFQEHSKSPGIVLTVKQNRTMMLLIYIAYFIGHPMDIDSLSEASVPEYGSLHLNG